MNVKFLLFCFAQVLVSLSWKVSSLVVEQVSTLWNDECTTSGINNLCHVSFRLCNEVYLTSWFSNCMQKAVTSVRLSWDLRKKPFNIQTKKSKFRNGKYKITAILVDFTNWLGFCISDLVWNLYHLQSKIFWRLKIWTRRDFSSPLFRSC